MCWTPAWSDMTPEWLLGLLPGEVSGVWWETAPPLGTMISLQQQSWWQEDHCHNTFGDQWEHAWLTPNHSINTVVDCGNSNNTFGDKWKVCYLGVVGLLQSKKNIFQERKLWHLDNLLGMLFVISSDLLSSFIHDFFILILLVIYSFKLKWPHSWLWIWY